jgi:hypothetical protein
MWIDDRTERERETKKARKTTEKNNQSKKDKSKKNLKERTEKKKKLDDNASVKGYNINTRRKKEKAKLVQYSLYARLISMR